VYHHAEPHYVMLTAWLAPDSPCTLPPGASHQVYATHRQAPHHTTPHHTTPPPLHDMGRDLPA
jgi:hypothetical protein